MKQAIWKRDDKEVNVMVIETKDTTLTDEVITLLYQSEDLDMLEELDISNLNEYKDYVWGFDIEIKEIMVEITELQKRFYETITEWTMNVITQEQLEELLEEQGYTDEEIKIVMS